MINGDMNQHAYEYVIHVPIGRVKYICRSSSTVCR